MKMTTYYLQFGDFCEHCGVFFKSRARTARGLRRAALKAAGLSPYAGLPVRSRICETETRGDITTALTWCWVELDFDNDCFY